MTVRNRKISDLLNDIDKGKLQLPQLQRRFLWTRKQVIQLVNSLYRDYPVGTMLVWDTDPDEPQPEIRGELAPPGGWTSGPVAGRATTHYSPIRHHARETTALF